MNLKPGLRFLIEFGIFLALAFAAGVVCVKSCHAQTDSTIYVKQFPGVTVGAKVAAAQLTCNTSNASVPCLLVIDPSLAAYATGTMPTLCSQCFLIDWRTPPPWSGSGFLPANSFGALNDDGAGELAWVPPTPVLVTQAPYNAACDGSTDDSAAIQACLDNNAVCAIPTGPSPPVQCNIDTGIQLCSANNHFSFNSLLGNGQMLQYSGTGSAITVESECFITWHIQDLVVNLSAASGTPTAITVNSAQSGSIEQVADNPISIAPGSYTSLHMVTDDDNAVKNSNFDGNITLTDSQSDFFYSGTAENLFLGGDGDTFISWIWDGIQTQTFAGGGNWFASNNWSGPMEFDGGTFAFTASGVTSLSSPLMVFTGSANILNGDFVIQPAGPLSFTGSFTGTFNVTDVNRVLYPYVNGLLPSNTNCLTTACAGGSTYVSGTTYTNHLSVGVFEAVSMTASGGACAGSRFTLVSTIAGVGGPHDGISNACDGEASITFFVPTGATFVVTATQTDGGTSEPFSIDSWLETIQ